MRSRLLLAALLIAFATVHVAADEAVIPSVPQDTVITMQHGACERRCAVYKVAIFADGVALFDGEYFVKRKGTQSYRVSPELIGRFLQHARQAGFFEMPDSFSKSEGPECVHVTNDAPVIVVSIAAGGRAKAVVHDHRCTGPDLSRLTLIENEIDLMAGVSRRVR